MYRPAIALIVSAGALCASGNQTRTPTAPNAAEIRISSATVPVGGTVQLQFSLTEPRPIMSTGGSFAMDSFGAWGISLWTPTGEACGVGALVDGKLVFTGIDPTGTLGSSADYPFMTLTMKAPTALPVGTTVPFSWDPGAWLANAGTPYDLTVKAGQVVIGGTASISGVYPGGGTWPAGTEVRIEGTGFTPDSKLITKVAFSSIKIEPQAIRIVLKSATRLDSMQFTVQNPDRSEATYYAYLRGAWLQAPSKALMLHAEYAFPMATHAVASVTASSAVSSGQFQGLALQNPTTGPAVVTLTRTSGSGTLTAMVVLPAGTRMADTLPALLGGEVAGGDTIQLTSTAMIQIMGVDGDEGTGSLTPFIPKF